MKVFDYEDVQLIPNKRIVNNCPECDTIVISGKHSLKMPTVPVNTQTVIDGTIMETLAENGYFHIIHQFNEKVRVPSIKKMQQKGLITSISVGVKEGEYASVETSAREGLVPDYMTIDIAHGHSNAVINMIQHLKEPLPETSAIADSVGTPGVVRGPENAGVDTAEVEIGPGKVCITRIKTGFGTGGRQLATLRQYAKAARGSIITDGGVWTHGDIAKSVRLRTAIVMIDSLLAGHKESPGETKVEDGVICKEYFGSASEFQKGGRKNVEGKKIWLRHEGKLVDTLVEMQQDSQSPISYAGGRDLEVIRKVGHVIVKNFIFNGNTI